MDEEMEQIRKAAQLRLLVHAVEQAEQHKKSRMSCANCGWFAVRSDEKIGECHRYPPTVDMPKGHEWKFAMVSRDNVCGEFVHHRTGASFKADSHRAITVRVARLEEEIERLRNGAAD